MLSGLRPATLQIRTRINFIAHSVTNRELSLFLNGNLVFKVYNKYALILLPYSVWQQDEGFLWWRKNVTTYAETNGELFLNEFDTMF